MKKLGILKFVKHNVYCIRLMRENKLTYVTPFTILKVMMYNVFFRSI